LIPDGIYVIHFEFMDSVFSKKIVKLNNWSSCICKFVNLCEILWVLCEKIKIQLLTEVRKGFHRGSQRCSEVAR
jgi:hypothetical protein